jgi:hypothetical protein
MLITRISQVSGVERTLDLDITEDQIQMYNSGMLLQRAFPNLSPADREFFKTGISDQEWQDLFAEDGDGF